MGKLGDLVFRFPCVLQLAEGKQQRNLGQRVHGNRREFHADTFAVGAPQHGLVHLQDLFSARDFCDGVILPARTHAAAGFFQNGFQIIARQIQHRRFQQALGRRVGI